MSLAAQERSALSVLLARTADNSAFYTALTAADGVREINELAGLRADPRYRLVRVDRRLGPEENQFEIALVDDFELSVAFYDKVTLVCVPRVSSRLLARNVVWRSASSSHSLALRDISQKVLFNYIVQYYDIFLEADTMTDGGNFNWHRQVSTAIEKGLYVFGYDPTTQALQSIPTQRALNDLQDLAWSNSNHEALRAVISLSPLASRLEIPTSALGDDQSH
ncbi:hypothetical protein H4C48_18720 [Pseudomonas asiatica]|uniref:hypothetical protein n=1 Tax=Pseudomonas asiatica TaxID=2219225 RepID=UPI0015FB30DB|nr:hypothetical protein [Pseudomonas asiatica]MBA6112387.1 hypothetical protein [Pseudomonas asiatica]